MKSSTITNSLLAIIAFCLVVHLAIELKFIPTAQAAPVLPQTGEITIRDIDLQTENFNVDNGWKKAIPVYIIEDRTKGSGQ